MAGREALVVRCPGRVLVRCTRKRPPLRWTSCLPVYSRNVNTQSSCFCSGELQRDHASRRMSYTRTPPSLVGCIDSESIFGSMCPLGRLMCQHEVHSWCVHSAVVRTCRLASRCRNSQVLRSRSIADCIGSLHDVFFCETPCRQTCP